MSKVFGTIFKVPSVPDRTPGIEDYQGTTKALQPVKLPEAAAQTECGAVKHPADAR